MKSVTMEVWSKYDPNCVTSFMDDPQDQNMFSNEIILDPQDWLFLEHATTTINV
jgi:hypothetical protein